MSKKAIIFDIDGTAIDSPKQKLPSKNLIKEIQRLQDKYLFCAATGRAWSFVKPVFEALKLKDLAVISAGTQICDPQTGEIKYRKSLDREALNRALAVLKNYSDYKLLSNDMTEDDYFNGGIYPSDFKITEPIYFLEQAFIPDEIAKEIHQKLTRIKGVAVVMVVAQKPGCRDIHVINESATKEHTIAELLKLLEIDRKNTIGVGDGYNDVHLFNAVNYKVAVGNAVPELKEMADKVIKSASEDGLADYLRSL